MVAASFDFPGVDISALTLIYLIPLVAIVILALIAMAWSPIFAIVIARNTLAGDNGGG